MRCQNSQSILKPTCLWGGRVVYFDFVIWGKYWNLGHFLAKADPASRKWGTGFTVHLPIHSRILKSFVFSFPCWFDPQYSTAFNLFFSPLTRLPYWNNSSDHVLKLSLPEKFNICIYFYFPYLLQFALWDTLHIAYAQTFAHALHSVPRIGHSVPTFVGYNAMSSSNSSLRFKWTDFPPFLTQGILDYFIFKNFSIPCHML